jgi:hypothetical protein
METITVKKTKENTYHVVVESRTRTEHTVTLPSAYYQKLTRGTISQEELIRKSFEFLLDREPNTSILDRFELSLISSYFPDFEKRIPNY